MRRYRSSRPSGESPSRTAGITADGVTAPAVCDAGTHVVYRVPRDYTVVKLYVYSLVGIPYLVICYGNVIISRSIRFDRNLVISASTDNGIPGNGQVIVGAVIGIQSYSCWFRRSDTGNTEQVVPCGQGDGISFKPAVGCMLDLYTDLTHTVYLIIGNNRIVAVI